MSGIEGVVQESPGRLLRIEGLAVLVLCLLFYRNAELGWGMFFLLFLSPDLSMIGYVAGSSLGARTYNAVHSYVGPLILVAIHVLSSSGTAASLALIWLAHAGFDRMLGYGLKYRDKFGHTHLGLIGKERALVPN